jgi:hypothetical protein
MGSNAEYILASKAAKILNCPVKKVHALADQGLIRKQIEGDEIFYRVEDINEIHKLSIAGEMKPGEMIRRILFLEREVSRLKDAVNLLYEVNQMASSRFVQMDDFELLKLYENALENIGEDFWSIMTMTSFGEIFMKITEVEIDKLNELLSVDSSWRTFYELCMKLYNYVLKNKELKTNLELQRVRDILYLGKKNLATIAVLMTEKASQLGPSRRLLDKLTATDAEMFDSVAKQLHGERKNKRNKQLVGL